MWIFLLGRLWCPSLARITPIIVMSTGKYGMRLGDATFWGGGRVSWPGYLWNRRMRWRMHDPDWQSLFLFSLFFGFFSERMFRDELSHFNFWRNYACSTWWPFFSSRISYCVNHSDTSSYCQGEPDGAPRQDPGKQYTDTRICKWSVPEKGPFCRARIGQRWQWLS